MTTLLKVKYDDRELAKSLGAKWDTEQKCWYADSYSKLKIIEQWFPKPKKTILKQTVVEEKKLTDYEIYNMFVEIPSRFKNGREVLDYLKLDKNKIKKTSGFCPMCDSNYTNEWAIGKIEISHYWDIYEKNYLTPKELFILYLYLEDECS